MTIEYVSMREVPHAIVKSIANIKKHFDMQGEYNWQVLGIGPIGESKKRIYTRAETDWRKHFDILEKSIKDGAVDNLEIENLRKAIEAAVDIPTVTDKDTKDKMFKKAYVAFVDENDSHRDVINRRYRAYREPVPTAPVTIFEDTQGDYDPWA